MPARPRHRLAPLLAIFVVALALGACGGGSSPQGQQGQGGGGQQKSGDEVSADTTIGMEDIEYVPKTATVKAGGTVLWTNSDAVAHTVTKADGPGPDFDSGTMPPGATFKQKFTEAGKIDYVCTIHPNQTGTLTVK